MNQLIPLQNQPYNRDLAKTIAFRLVCQAPMVVSWVIGHIITKIEQNSNLVPLKELAPQWSCTLSNHNEKSYQKFQVMHTPYTIVQRLIQFLLWTESNAAESLEDIAATNYQVRLAQIPKENIELIQSLISEYSSNLIQNEISLMRYENTSSRYYTISDNENLNMLDTMHIAQAEFITNNREEAQRFEPRNATLRELILDALIDYSKNNSKNFNLPYKYDGVGSIKALVFIRAYDSATTRDGWSLKEKAEYLPDHLQEKALEWYFQTFPGHHPDWNFLKLEFMRYFAFSIKY